MNSIKRGRPAHGEFREDLKKITFLADQATLISLKKLEFGLKKQGVVSTRSVAIRNAIIQVAK